jgi:hypothetical protein
MYPRCPLQRQIVERGRVGGAGSQQQVFTPARFPRSKLPPLSVPHNADLPSTPPPPPSLCSDAIKRIVTMSSLFQNGTPALQQLLHHDRQVASSCLLAANLFCLSSKNISPKERIEAFEKGAKSIANCPQRRLMRRYGVATREAALELLASSLAVSALCNAAS